MTTFNEAFEELNKAMDELKEELMATRAAQILTSICAMLDKLLKKVLD